MVKRNIQLVFVTNNNFVSKWFFQQISTDNINIKDKIFSNANNTTETFVNSDSKQRKDKFENEDAENSKGKKQ